MTRLSASISRRRRLWLSLRTGFFVMLAILLLWQTDFFVSLRLGSTNLYHVSKATTGNVVIVAMDDASLQSYGRTPAEWSRLLHAQLVEVLSQANARVIAFDILFAEPHADDTTFADAVVAARTSRAATRTIVPVASLNTPQFIKTNETLRNVAEYQGYVSNFPDQDGVVRWLLMQAQAEEETYFSLSIAAYFAYLRIPPTAVSQLVKIENDQLHLTPQRQIDIDDQNRMMLSFFGPSNTFPTYSYRDVLEGKVNPVAFNDKIVLVGLMNSEGQSDSYAVPIGFNGNQMAGVEIHANAIEALLQNISIRPQSKNSEYLMIVGLTLFLSVFYGQLPRRHYWLWLLIFMLTLSLIWVFIALTIFNTQGVVINLFHSLLAIILPAPAILAQHATLERALRQQTELLHQSILAASAQQLSLDSIMPTIAADLSQILGCEHVEIWLWDVHNQALSCSFPTTPNPASQPIVEKILTHKTFFYQESVLAIPLTWHQQVLGAFVASPVHPPKPDTKALLDLFVWQTSSILANANLLHETQHLSDLKTRLIRMASHDLKNPLMAILNFSTFLLEDHKKSAYLSATHEEFIEGTLISAREMQSIINDILSLERARSTATTKFRFNAVEMIEESLARFDKQFQDNQLTLIRDIPLNEITLLGDKSQLFEAISNILSNAIKYTPNGGKITVRVSHSAQHLLLEITDTGYGIPKAAQSNLFQEFYRVRTRQTSHIEGTGLGLSLVKAVIQAHDGKVWVESDEGSGSSFFITLPIID